MTDMIQIREVDVLIVGGGPVGLLTGYSLARFGVPSICILERYPKSTQAAFGRAITFWPRSIELLDQLDLLPELLQSAFICRRSATFDRNGNEVQGRGWSFLSGIGGTYQDFALVLRQKYTEAAIREQLAKLYNINVETPVELVSFTEDSATNPDYPLVATVRRGTEKTSFTMETIRCKYILGCDGARSTVREIAQIKLDTSSTVDKWVRIDGVLKTDVPAHLSRSYIAFESPTHGNVLWAPLDRGTTRIGYAYTPEREATYGKAGEVEFTQEIAVKEAIEACKPFKVEFERVDWHTLYVVRQSVAQALQSKGYSGRVLIAGDSAHQHSSAAAQGQNQGLHDAINLGWKLALVLKNRSNPSLLETYTTERLPVARQLIRYDQDVAALMSLKVPPGYDQSRDPNDILGDIFGTATGFNTGLGIKYPDSTILTGSPSPLCSHKPGERAPDIYLTHPGHGDAVRLLRACPNYGNFHLLIFLGKPTANSNAFLAKLRDYVPTSKLESSLFNFITISVHNPARTYSIFETLDGHGLGKTYFDIDGKGHERYGIATYSEIVIVCIRPDGWIGWVGAVGEVLSGGLENWAEGFIKF